jgi:ribosome-associated protein
VLLDLRPDAIIADFFIICTANSDRQLRALADHLRIAVKEQVARIARVEGTPESGWMLMDYGDIIVHLFLIAEREYYDLEGLWRREANVLLSIQ